jgi:hypothetical protein
VEVVRIEYIEHRRAIKKELGGWLVLAAVICGLGAYLIYSGITSNNRTSFGIGCACGGVEFFIICIACSWSRALLKDNSKALRGLQLYQGDHQFQTWLKGILGAVKTIHPEDIPAKYKLYLELPQA